MFIATLFVVAKSWKPPQSPSTGERINCGAINTKKQTIDTHDLEGFQRLYA